MILTKLPPTYIEQSTSFEIRQYKAPLESKEVDEPVKPIYYLTEVQITPISGTAEYKPERLDWLRRDDYQPRQTPDLTYLYQSGSVFF